MDTEELRRICHAETERVRQLRTDEVCAQETEELSTMNQLLSQIRTLQDKVNTLNDEREFYDPETASSSGPSHVSSQPSRIPSPRGVLSHDSGCIIHGIQWVFQVMFFENHLPRNNFSILTRNFHETWRRIDTRTAKFNTAPRILRVVLEELLLKIV